jgi:hypothetical protein
MPPYRLGWKFNSNDDIVIVSEASSRIINFVLQDMGVGSISGKMLNNPLGNKKTMISVQKSPLVEDTKIKIVQKSSQVIAPRKWGHKVVSKLANAPLKR